jgi:hypothetical protein
VVFELNGAKCTMEFNEEMIGFEGMEDEVL